MSSSKDQMKQATRFNEIVTIHDYMPPWSVVTSGPPARFHEQFWGKSMDEEEQDWRSTQAQTPQPPISAGIVLGGQDTDVSIDEDEDNEDDIIAGCYLLETNLEPYERIWIRADYIRIYNALLTHYTMPGVNSKAPSAIITGQRGVGKSAWVYYAMRRRLSERQPFIWYYRGRCLMFAEDGVFSMPDNFQEAVFNTTVWTFVDSDVAEDIPSYLVLLGTDLFVIYTTPPYKERWSRLRKTTREAILKMNPWTRTEIHRAISTRLPGVDFRKVDEIFDRFGPTPRLCFELLEENRLANYECSVEKAIKAITLDTLETLLQEPMGPTMRAISQKVCLVSREKREDVHSLLREFPITRFIQSRMTNHIRNLRQEEQLRLYRSYVGFRDTRRLVGILFEAMALQDFKRGVVLQIIPMVKLDKIQRPQWYSSHTSLQNPLLEMSRQQALRESYIIHINTTQTEEFLDKGPESILPNILYVPQASNHEALDPFFLLDNRLYIFQFAIEATHEIMPGLVHFFGQYPNLPMSSWRFVFVIPPDLELTYRQPQNSELRDLLLYSAEYNPTTTGMAWR